MSRRSLYLEYGGDFVISPQGSLQLAVDDQNSATATTQRLTRLVLTTPIQKDQYGRVIGRGDSYFYPQYGASLRTYVDSTPTASDLAAIRAAILNGIAQDPGIARTPAPIVTITQPDSTSLLVYIQVVTASGQTVTLPNIVINSQAQ